jgi:hypothetical protein
MASNKNFQEEEKRQEKKPVYRYWKCPGKKTENGERHPVCSGRIYEIDGGVADYCPVCGTSLVFLQTATPREDAIKCALGRCAECRNRNRAVKADCLGGDKVIVWGAEQCRSCVCRKCCEDLRTSVTDFKRNPIEYFKARKIIFREMSGVSRGIEAKELEAIVDGVKSHPAMKILSETTVEWEMTEALRKIRLRRESAG